MYKEYLGLLRVQVQFGAFGEFPIFGNFVSQKPLVITKGETDQNLSLRDKFLLNTIVYGVVLTDNCSSSAWGHSMHF